MADAFIGEVTAQAVLRLPADQRRGFDAWLQTLTGERVTVTVEKYRDRRSTRANRYYFGVVVKLLAEHCGYEVDEMHETLAMKFLRIADCPVTGAPRRQRTPKTSTQEFSNYVEACIRLAAELGVVIPEAGE
jgi:hypothetical protein